MYYFQVYSESRALDSVTKSSQPGPEGNKRLSRGKRQRTPGHKDTSVQGCKDTRGGKVGYNGAGTNTDGRQ